jgi:hypothetical protein
LGLLTKYQIKKNEMGGACMEERRGTYRILVGRPDGKRWKGSIKWIFKKWDGEAWTRLIWLR